MKKREASTAAKVAALSTKTQPVPTSAIRMPATAGPASRALWNESEFSATAFGGYSTETSSETKAWRAGASIADAKPSAKAKAQKCHSAATPARTTIES